MKVEFHKGEMIISAGEHSLKLAIAAGEDTSDPSFVISLDGAETWDPPGEGAPISIEDLQQMSAAIERACKRMGVRVEFE